MRVDNEEYYFLRNGGEMGALIRATDWSKTALGDPAGWPQSLRTMVAVMLDNPFGMYIAWGEEYTQLYNDGYRPILGASKHPQALGISTRETFAEIWHIVGPMFEGVMRGQAVGFPDFMLPLHRNGFIEECYFDFSYSPIRKDDGSVGGVLVTVIETTQKKKTEAALKESNERFRRTMQQAPVGITILRGKEFTVEMANDAYLRLINKTAEGFVGRPLFSSLPEVRETVDNLLTNVLETGTPFHGNEVPIPLNRFGTTSIYYFDFLYYPLHEPNGDISGVIVAVTESTEKVKGRKQIEESKRLYEAITQNTPDLIYVFGLDYRFEYANDALLRMWGKTWETSIGKNLLENGYEPWHAEMHEREIDQVVATKAPIRGEVSFPHASLGRRVYDYIFVPLFDEKGNVEAVAGTTRDITEQVLARQHIAESEEQFRTLAQTLPQLVWVTDAHGYPSFASNRWKEYSGVEPTGPEAWKAIVHPEDYERINREWGHSLATGVHYRGEVRLRSAGGEYHWFSVNGTPVHDQSNSIVKWIGAFTDIQEQKLKEEKKDEFISIASHELKTPLTTAKAYLQLLELILPANNEQAKLYAKNAHLSVSKINELVEELLDVSKIRLGKLNYRISTFDFAELMQSTVANFQLTVPSHHIIITELAPAQVTGDQDRLQQVIINLLSNAVKYSPQSSEVHISVAAEKSRVLVSVLDTGVGIN
ncbi:MAG: PAS domain-containing protein, partial [Bacteroidota bacterium]|nr:PAS domain-containing protein [Bacteroidota bacterium]